MSIRKAYVFSLFFLLISVFNAFAVEKDPLIVEFEKAKSDTARVKLCFLLSKNLESSNPDSAFYWLNRGLSISKNCTNSLNDTTLCYYHGVIISSIGRLNAILSKDLDLAKEQMSEGIGIFNRLIEIRAGRWIETKSFKGLALSYGVLGRIAYNRGELANAIQLYTQTLALLEQLGDENGLSMMYNNLGVMHRLQSNYAQSLIYYQKAYEFFEKNNDSLSIASVLLNMGSISQDIGAYDKSLESYHKALDIFKASDQKKNIASALINIGDVLVSEKNTAAGIEYFRQALIQYKILDDQKGIADVYHSLGCCFKDLNALDSAFYYLNRSKKVNEVINNKIGLANNYHILGEIYYGENKLESALRNFKVALEIAEKIGISKANSMLFIAKVHCRQGNYEQALQWTEDALGESKKNGLITLQKDAYEALATIYESIGNYSLAYINFKHYFDIYDSVLSRDRSHKFAELETLYQLEQKEKAIKHLEQEKAIKDFELKQAENVIYWQRVRSYFSLGVMLILVIILFLVYSQFKTKRSANKSLKQQFLEIQEKNEEITVQKEKIEFQNKEMSKQQELLKEKSEQLERFNWVLMDSIDYASNIQTALLPSDTSFDKFFEDHFTVFFPKDVVSGDFYWAYSKDNSIIIAVADCTGHGVPGGFMSMLGISTLNDLISRGITDPAEIINSLREIIIDSFKQTGKIGEQQDGMDISIVRYSKGMDYIEFAGANHSLLLVKSNNARDGLEMIEYKGEKMSASYHPRMKPFTSQRIEVGSNDQFYLFTDGFYHQLGGHMYTQKFGKENFKKLILDNARNEMESQKSIIEDTFFRWVSMESDQLDDITIMGFKI